MTAAWMLYCTGIAVAFVVFGEALERALHLARRPTRWAWGLALAGSYLVPAAAWLRPNAFGALPVSLARPTIAATAGPLDPRPTGGAPPTPARPFSLVDLDTPLTLAWGLSAGAVALALLGAVLRLAAWRRRWRVTTLDGRTVLVSENVGPAVIGLWRPQVVLPAWALELRPGERRLMLLHEDEHVRARDPWLRAAGAVSLVLAPWNPALWWQVRRLRLAVEMDCDARVLARGGETPEYAELLLRVGQRRARLPLGAPALGEPVSFLGRRIRRMVTDLPRWRWAGATAASMVAAAVIIAACEAPRPVGPREALLTQSGATPEARRPREHADSLTTSAPHLEALARAYHPEVFTRALRQNATVTLLDGQGRVFAHEPAAAVALVFDARGRLSGHAGGVREVSDEDCLAVVERLVPRFRASAWSTSGCARTYQGVVVVYWKVLKQAQGSDDALSESMVDERPVFLSGPPLQYPPLLRNAGIQGRVIVQAIIDTTGRAEPASVQVIDSPHPGFNQAARKAVLQARFRHGLFHGRAVPVLITFPVDFRARG